MKFKRDFPGRYSANTSGASFVIQKLEGLSEWEVRIELGAQLYTVDVVPTYAEGKVAVADTLHEVAEFPEVAEGIADSLLVDVDTLKKALIK